jgi:hypothetical protein
MIRSPSRDVTEGHDSCLRTKTFSELSLKNHQYKKLALASAILFLAVVAILVLELIGAKH